MKTAVAEPTSALPLRLHEAKVALDSSAATLAAMAKSLGIASPDGRIATSAMEGLAVMSIQTLLVGYHLRTLELPEAESLSPRYFNAACKFASDTAQELADGITRQSTLAKSPALAAELREARKLILKAKKLVEAAKR